MRDSSLQFFMFTFPNKGDTLDLFSLSGLSISKVFFFLLWFALTIYSPESFMGSSALQYEVEWVPFTFHSMWGVKKSKWMLVNNNMLSHYFLFWRIQKKKRCKNVVNVWLKVSLAGLHISDSFVYQRNTIALKIEERFAVLYIKWCLFSILTLQVTSEGATSTGFCTYM